MHTGNTAKISFFIIFFTVYPCAYREHTASNDPIFCACGLSLCIQGTHNKNAYKRSEQRFIPVHTGNTDKTYFDKIVASVYPCAYREHSHSPSTLLGAFGLSLCIQGTHRLRGAPVLNDRFISVHTGNT